MSLPRADYQCARLDAVVAEAGKGVRVTYREIGAYSRLTIPALLERSAHEFGDETYLITPTDRLTYREAENRSADSPAGCWPRASARARASDCSSPTVPIG